MCFGQDETALDLPCLHWGNTESVWKVLLVHGFLSSAETFLELAEGMVAKGWYVTAVDLRGHGSAPKGSKYRIEDYALDLEQVVLCNGAPWDLVIAHSMGAAASAVVASKNSRWCNRLAMLDPCLYWTRTSEDEIASFVRCCKEETVQDVHRSHPHWNTSVVEAKIKGQRAVPECCIRETLISNSARDFRFPASQLDIPIFILGADLSKTTFNGWGSCAVKDNVSFVRLDGTSHNPHRDKPVEALHLIGQWAYDTAMSDAEFFGPPPVSSITCEATHQSDYLAYPEILAAF